MKKDPLIFIEHILESIIAIEEFSKNISKKELGSNRLIQSATVKEIEIIGEATKNLSLNFREKYPEVPWNKIAGTRDKLSHHYFGIDIGIIWDVIKEDIPVLKKQIQKIRKDLE